jgi:hypothetical protein
MGRKPIMTDKEKIPFGEREIKFPNIAKYLKPFKPLVLKFGNDLAKEVLIDNSSFTLIATIVALLLWLLSVLLLIYSFGPAFFITLPFAVFVGSAALFFSWYVVQGMLGNIDEEARKFNTYDWKYEVPKDEEE